MHDGQARRTNRMRNDGRRLGPRNRLQSEIGDNRTKLARRNAADDERSPIELHVLKFERFFGGVHPRVAEFVAQRDERIVAVVIHDKDGSLAANAAGNPERSLDLSHRSIQHLHVCNAHDLHVAELAKGPCGVIVRTALRIVRAPVLVVEKHVRDPAVGLVHANQIRACRKLHDFGGGFFFVVLFILVRLVILVALRLAHRHREWSRGLNNLTPLQLQDAQQFGLSAGPRIVCRKDVCRRAFVLWLVDGPLALQIKVTQKQLAVLRKVVERDQQAGLLVIIVVAL